MPVERWTTLYRTAPSGCWVWVGRRDPDGYGRLARGRLAHRAAFESVVGPIPADMQIDHLCRLRSCVNPQHLQAVTALVNVLRGTGPTAVNARKQSCANGHPFDEANTYLRPNGSRDCRTCGRERVRRYKQRSPA